MTILGEWDSGALPTVWGAGVTSSPTGGPGGVPAIQLDQAVGDVSQLRFLFASSTTVAARGYFLMPSGWPSSAASILVFRPNSSTIVARSAIAGSGQPGQLRLLRVGGTTHLSSSNNAIAVSTWYRFEIQVDQVVGQARMAVFPLQSDIAIWDTGWTSGDFGNEVTRVEFGPASNSPTLGMIRVAALRVTDDVSGWIGRASWDQAGPPPVIDVERPAPNLVDLRGSTAGGGTLTYSTPVRVSGPTLVVSSLASGLWLFEQSEEAASTYFVEVVQTDSQSDGENVTVARLPSSHARIWDPILGEYVRI